MSFSRLFVPLLLPALAACGPVAGAISVEATDADPPMKLVLPTHLVALPTSFESGAIPVGGDRPVFVHVPLSYDPTKPAPLVIMLHGYGASGAIEEAYLRLTPQSDEYGFLYVYPDGTIDQAGNRFWNATTTCCDFYDTGVDDSAYLKSLIVEIEAHYNVAPRQVYVVGHSNGAFMAYRMACDHADLIGGVVSFAGAMWDDVDYCSPSQPLRILEIHGTDDPLLPYYAGGFLRDEAFPSTPTTILDWVGLNGCTEVADTRAAPLDLDSSIPGPETTIARYGTCAGGSDAELWTMHGGDHVPVLTDNFPSDVVRHLLVP